LAAWERQSTECSSGAPGVSILTCTAICSSGKKVLGGGVSNSNALWQVSQSYPVDDPGWTVTLSRLNGNTTITVTTYALCANTN
jgi:hypothetical protein